MTVVEIKEIVNGYGEDLLESDTMSVESECMYVLDMICRMNDFTEEDEGKANRWLGFIQGVLWSGGVYTIDEMREHNRK